LEPCGTGNPEPRLLLRNAFLVESRTMGQGQEHLRWTIEADGRPFKGVWWRPGEKAQGCECGCRVDICFVPELNHWNNNVTLQLNVKEARVVR
jgi:single-stranded-DNA-specific exonuclease